MSADSTLSRHTSFRVHKDHFKIVDLNKVETNVMVIKAKANRRNLVVITPGNPGIKIRLLFFQIVLKTHLQVFVNFITILRCIYVCVYWFSSPSLVLNRRFL